MTDDMLAEILKIYKPIEPRPIFYRAYYDSETNQVLHLSQQEMDMPFVEITKEQFDSCATDIWRIDGDRMVRKDEYFQHRLQLRKGSTYATLKGDMQFAVEADWSGDKDLWDANS